MEKNLRFSKTTIVGISLLLLPFSYYSFSGVRVIIMGAILILVVISMNGLSFRRELDFFVFILNIALTFFLSVLTSNENEFLAIFIFFIFMYWPSFCSNFYPSENDVSKLSRLYIYSAVFCSVGVIFQSFLFNSLGIEFGKVDTYLNRTGFGFLWLDYSFLSLFLASSLPLVFRENLKFKYIVSLVLVIGSITTTARTGLFSILLSMILLSSISILYGLVKRKFKRTDIIILVMFFSLMTLIYFLWGSYSNRELTFSGSGRFDGYYNSFLIFLENPFLGYSYNVSEYRELYGAVPHNIFLYIMIFGGIFGFIIFMTWLVLFYIRIRTVDYFFKLSILSIFIGLQFIPSYYSGYFVAMILSISMLSLKVRNE
ncbi:O-antigen ligase family protein [Vibrio parahaemolyticus]|nr:O-antigen ligase family protein [Vibrio parahaemolyticus]